MYYYGYRRRKRKRPGPRKVKNGIKVRAKRGDLGQGWLAKAWIDALEDAYPSGSFTRGRTYARKGQVLSVDVKKGSIEAMVQGSARSPHRMNMTVGMAGDPYRKKFAGLLAKKPSYAAAILAGEMPEELADDLASLGLDLFPTRSELVISCECDEWSRMCKHAASASYILAEEFDRDPLLYLKIRGIDRKEFLALLEPDMAETSPDPPPPVDVNPPPKPTPTRTPGWGAMRGILEFRPPEPVPITPLVVLPPDTTRTHADGDKEDVVIEPTQLLGGVVSTFCIPGMPEAPDGQTQIPSDMRQFWGAPGHAPESYDSALAPSEPAALPKTLGRFPMWRGEDQFITLMEKIYSQASLRGANAYLGIRETPGGGASKGARKK